jgi:hypothetical protein
VGFEILCEPGVKSVSRIHSRYVLRLLRGAILSESSEDANRNEDRQANACNETEVFL